MSDESSYQSKKEVKWEKEDTAFLMNITRKNNKAIPTTYEEIEAKHKSLGY